VEWVQWFNFVDVGGFADLILDKFGILENQIPTAIFESLLTNLRNQFFISIDNRSWAQRWLGDFWSPNVKVS